MKDPSPKPPRHRGGSGRAHSIRLGHVAAVSVAVLLILFMPSKDHALGGCPDMAIDGNLTAVDGFLLAGGTCKAHGVATDNWLSDGGYIRTDTPMTAHTSADTSGKCLWGGWAYPPGICVYMDYNDVRAVDHVNIREEPPGLLPTLSWVYPVDRRTQHLNTRNAGTTSGPLVRSSLGTVGTWTYKFASIVKTTLCNIMPGQSEVKQRQVEVVACLPNFAFNGSPDVNGIEHIPLDTPITFSVPSDALATAVSDAIANWQAKLQPYATFTGTTGTCAPIDPHCIQVVVAYPPDDPRACSQTVRISPGPGGETTRGSMIYINPAYGSWTQHGQAYLNYLLNHEFAHLFGLRNSINCAPNRQTVTAGAESEETLCGEYPARYSPIPTVSDGLSAGRSAYGQIPDKTCSIP